MPERAPPIPPREPPVGSTSLTLELLPGAPALLALHARELPQRDDLCGAFCGSLALRAAGLVEHASEPLDQDAVARAAGSVISPPRAGGALPRGERGRRDYRVQPPTIPDGARSGTTAAGLVAALEGLAGGRVRALPYSDPWNEGTLAGLFDVAVARERPVALLANLATRHLWGGRPGVAEILGQLLAGAADDGPRPDWDVGHFVCVVGRARGPGGDLYVVADTYPALGYGGVHVQPPARLAAAIARRDMPAGGVIAVVDARDVATVRAGAAELGLREGAWDNGTLARAGAGADAGTGTGARTGTSADAGTGTGAGAGTDAGTERS